VSRFSSGPGSPLPGPGFLDEPAEVGHALILSRDDQLGHAPVPDLLARPAAEPLRPVVPEGDAAVQAGDNDRVAGLVDVFGLFAEGGLGPAADPALAPLAQRPLDGGGQALHPVLEHIVGGTGLHRLDGEVLADGAGEEDEGGVGQLRVRELQGLEPAEARQLEVGKDEVVPAVPQSLMIARPPADHRDGAVRPFRGEQRADQFRRRWGRLRGGGSSWGRRIGSERGRESAGGGSLRRAQKKPSRLTAVMNSWKSTGLTTKAFAPSW